MGQHTISTPTPAGPWINVVDPFTIGVCTGLIRRSTLHSGIDKGATWNAYLINVSRKRTTLWLWLDLATLQMMTVAFHAADGPPPGTGRFCTCAGVDSSISSDAAADLWKEAVRQFVSINNTEPGKIFLWSEKDLEPDAHDRIHDVHLKIANGSCEHAGNETYDKNSRWPVELCTRKFKDPVV